VAFANQLSLTLPAVRQAARDVGLPPTTTRVRAHSELIREDVALGARGRAIDADIFHQRRKIGDAAIALLDQAIATSTQHAPSK
jgi:hypothetical protein